MKVARIAVTGATGQVGAALVHRLHAEGWPVVAATRNALGAALIEADTPGCEIRIGSLTPAPGSAHLLDDCDIILNCALAGSGGNPRQAYARNRQLVDGLLQAKALRRLIHFSTVAVYGELIQRYPDEPRGFAHPKPASEYGRSKLDVERYAARRCRARSLPLTVLRLGHVYGAGIGRSREIIELARHPEFQLPFDGRHASNAIHVERVGTAVLELLASGEGPEVVNLAEAAATWRHVFDWHTACLDLPRVSGMSEERSQAEHDVFARSSAVRDVLGWLRGLPLANLVRSPAVFDVALRVLASTPTGVTRRVTDLNRRVGARSLVARALGTRGRPLGPLYYSVGMPGPHLPLRSAPAAGADSEPARCHALRTWYQRWSTPPLAAFPEVADEAPAAR